jgi:hypothetical protein
VPSYLFTDRCYREFILRSGWNDLRISPAEVRLVPVGRELDMQQVEGIGIYVTRHRCRRFVQAFLPAIADYAGKSARAKMRYL